MGRRARPYVPRATHSSAPALETICRAHDPFFRARDLSGAGDAGVHDPMYRAHGPFFRARDPSDAGDSGVRDPVSRAHDPSGVRDIPLIPLNPT